MFHTSGCGMWNLLFGRAIDNNFNKRLLRYNFLIDIIQLAFKMSCD